MVHATMTRGQVRSDVVRLVQRGLRTDELTRAITRTLRRAVPFDGTCLVTMDPATLLPTGDVVDNGLDPDAVVRLSEIELREPDCNKFTALARAPRPAASPE